MISALLIALIYIAFACAILYLIIWFFGRMGFALPAQVVNILWVIVFLLALLYLWQAVGHGIPSPL